MARSLQEIIALLPAKDCGQCGFKTCEGLARRLLDHPEEIKRCVHLDAAAARDFRIPPVVPEAPPREITWQDMLARPYDLVLDPIPGDPGPREVILPYNPINVERLGIKKGDILYGRPAQAGCPVTHIGLVVEEPDVFNGLITWCVVGPLAAREHDSIEIGLYTPVAYIGIVKHTRVPLEIGRRYHFLPGLCMLQSRHSGVINEIARRPDGARVRLEGIWID